MKASLSAAFLLASISATTPALAEYAHLQVTRVSDDNYKTLDGRRHIQTRLCQEYVYGVSATLDHQESRNFGNKLTFDNGRTCEVVKVLGA